MTATTKFEGYLAEENVLLSVSDGATYVSKLGTPVGAQLVRAEDKDWGVQQIRYSLSGRKFTFHLDNSAQSPTSAYKLDAVASATSVFATIKGRL